MVPNNSVLGVLGLALRAGRLAIGDEPVHDLLALGKARCLFIASDAGSGIVRKIRRLAEEKQVVVLTLPQTKAELGFALGRASCAVCATSDSGFAASAAKKLSDIDDSFTEAAAALQKKHERLLSRRNKPRKKGAGNKVTTYIDIEEEAFDLQYGSANDTDRKDHK